MRLKVRGARLADDCGGGSARPRAFAPGPERLETRFLLSGGLTAEVPRPTLASDATALVSPLPTTTPSAVSNAELRPVAVQIVTSPSVHFSDSDTVFETSAPHTTPATAQVLPSVSNLTLSGTLDTTGSPSFYKIALAPTDATVRIEFSWTVPAAKHQASLGVFDSLGTLADVSVSGSRPSSTFATAMVDASGTLTVAIVSPAADAGTHASGFRLGVITGTGTTAPTLYGPVDSTLPVPGVLDNVPSIPCDGTTATQPSSHVVGELTGGETGNPGARLPLPSPSPIPLGGVIGRVNLAKTPAVVSGRGQTNAAAHVEGPEESGSLLMTVGPSALRSEPGATVTMSEDVAGSAGLIAVSPISRPPWWSSSPPTAWAERLSLIGMEPRPATGPGDALGSLAFTPPAALGAFSDRERAELPLVLARPIPEAPAVLRPAMPAVGIAKRVGPFARLVRRSTLVISGSSAAALVVWGLVPMLIPAAGPPKTEEE